MNAPPLNCIGLRKCEYILLLVNHLFTIVLFIVKKGKVLKEVVLFFLSSLNLDSRLKLSQSDIRLKS